MSAFIVAKTHIDALVTAGVKNRTHGPLYVHHGGIALDVRHANADLIGQALTDAVHASVNHRYRDAVNPPAYTFRMLDTDVLPPVVILSLIACYRYQACEIDGWDTTLAATYLNVIEAASIRELPGYDEAPWELTDEGYQALGPKRIVSARGRRS
ncbi:hypothetical protein [Demequina litorisediminis]|uniref:Uncharacterized protein n=1 Tax=Demequina litorisediminis TaxID=1849022 RepID=A0ABQ6IJI2_9MICO|nr:hypothetical protein [Demequina litorisediminis]GMA37786.1 hypothetical protein GCM10025876_39900 [Demequina litorisediminis]GMA37846.1 hypothetical protein GCM10025876_40500 [Demequina litorisediminis]GMA37894.1 hypothetical protein GCM10025876_40980 [Demequina litorisediminis]